MEIDISKLFPGSNIGELQEDEFLGTDGLPYCKKCKTKRFFTYEHGDKNSIMRCRCECQSEELRKEQEEEERKKRIEKFREQQKLSMLGSKYLNARFSKAIITPNNKEAYEKCKNYVTNAKDVIKNNFGLYIYGDNSSGKTYLTACMCNHLIAENFSCLYTNVPTLLAEIQKSYGSDNAMGQAEIVSLIERKHFVFIDDLGKEFLGREFSPNAAKFAEKVLLEVLNARYNNALPTIFSSNYSISELAESFSLDKAIMERISEMSTRIIKLEGDDFREKELKEKSELAKKFGI